jgi:hypothetical protein
MRIAFFGPVVAAMVVGCRPGDGTITRGADDQAAWGRRLAVAVPAGIAEDSALATMKTNGFACEKGTEPTIFLLCRKQSSGELVIRKWQAIISISDGKVIAVKGSTGLVGP